MSQLKCPQCDGPHTLDHCPRWRMPASLTPAMRDAVYPQWTLSPESMYADLLRSMGRQPAAPLVPQTDLAKRLLDMVKETGGPIQAVTVLKADLIAICCETNRYYLGMQNWKRTAEGNVFMSPEFKREDLQDVLEGMETEDQTVDVGEAHIESTAGYVCRLIRALLSAPPVMKIGD